MIVAECKRSTFTAAFACWQIGRALCATSATRTSSRIMTRTSSIDCRNVVLSPREIQYFWAMLGNARGNLTTKEVKPVQHRTRRPSIHRDSLDSLPRDSKARELKAEIQLKWEGNSGAAGSSKKKQLNFSVRNNGSTNLWRFVKVHFTIRRRLYISGLKLVVDSRIETVGRFRIMNEIYRAGFQANFVYFLCDKARWRTRRRVLQPAELIFVSLSTPSYRACNHNEITTLLHDHTVQIESRKKSDRD